jgi:hypothetical protein
MEALPSLEHKKAPLKPRRGLYIFKITKPCRSATSRLSHFYTKRGGTLIPPNESRSCRSSRLRDLAKGPPSAAIPISILWPTGHLRESGSDISRFTAPYHSDIFMDGVSPGDRPRCPQKKYIEVRGRHSDFAAFPASGSGQRATFRP